MIVRLLPDAQMAYSLLISNATNRKERDVYEEAMKSIRQLNMNYKHNATGNCCQGDKIAFIKRLWDRRAGTRYGKLSNVIAGYTIVEGEIIKESRSTYRQQSTFTILAECGERVLVKCSDLYAVGVWRKEWDDERERQAVLKEKYRRGGAARQDRQDRLELTGMAG